MSPKIKELFSEDEIQARIRQMGQEIAKAYKGRELHCLGVLKGSFIFMADLVRQIENERMSVDFLSISSYGDLTKSSGVVKLLTDLTLPIKGKDVLIVEDIVETGLTLRYLTDNLKTREPVSIRIASLLHKPKEEDAGVTIDFLGFTCPDKFVVGYGLDAAQRFRNLPFIGYIDEGDD